MWLPHAGGAHFAMVDGAVRFIRDEIDLAVYRAAASCDGGEVSKGPTE